MARPDALLLEVLLVVLLGAEEFRRRHNLRHDRALEDSRLVERRLSLARLGFLPGVVKENRRTILRAVVRTLPVELGRVVALKEDGEQLFIGNLGGIEFDLDRLGVARPVRANFLVRGIFGLAADIADRRRGYALD